MLKEISNRKRRIAKRPWKGIKISSMQLPSNYPSSNGEGKKNKPIGKRTKTMTLTPEKIWILFRNGTREEKSCPTIWKKCFKTRRK